MKYCTQINKKSVLKKAMILINQAKHSIHMTMDLKEEDKNPLPKTYHRKLIRLAKKNIFINRFAYGPKNLYDKMVKKFSGVTMYYGGTLNLYQRMLIVDKKKGLFALNGNVYYTTFSPLIKSLLVYAKII